MSPFIEFCIIATLVVAWVGSLLSLLSLLDYRRKARLIAAAPALLSALKAVVPEMRREHDAGDGHFYTAEVEAAEAAVRQAEGT